MRRRRGGRGRRDGDGSETADLARLVTFDPPALQGFEVEAEHPDEFRGRPLLRLLARFGRWALPIARRAISISASNAYASRGSCCPFARASLNNSSRIGSCAALNSACASIGPRTNAFHAPSASLCWVRRRSAWIRLCRSSGLLFAFVRKHSSRTSESDFSPPRRAAVLRPRARPTPRPRSRAPSPATTHRAQRGRGPLQLLHPLGRQQQLLGFRHRGAGHLREMLGRGTGVGALPLPESSTRRASNVVPAEPNRVIPENNSHIRVASHAGTASTSSRRSSTSRCAWMSRTSSTSTFRSAVCIRRTYRGGETLKPRKPLMK